jgi:hypothetical protein
MIEGLTKPTRDEEARGLKTLIEALPDADKKDPEKRAVVARKWAEIRQARNARALAHAKQGDSGCNLRSSVDVFHLLADLI